MHYEATLKTLRLSLEPLLASHAQDMFPILSDRQLYSFTGDEPPETQMALEERYRYLERRKSPDESQLWLNWLVTLKNDDTPMGYVQATVSKSHTDIAWVIGLQWQGNGYASEAASALVEWLQENGIKAIRCCIHPRHVASQRVAGHAGLNKSSSTEDGEDVWLL